MRIWWVGLLVVAMAGAGCAQQGQVGQERGAGRGERTEGWKPSARGEERIEGGVASGRVLAWVDGEGVGRERVVEVLMAGRGEAVLEMLVRLEVVRQEARRRGLGGVEELVEAEWGRILEDMAPGREEAVQEALLAYMLESRGLTRPEFALVVERRALLRGLVDSEVEVTQEQLEQEFTRQYGRQVVVRGLAVRQRSRLEEARRRLAAGEAFAAVAAELSEDERLIRSGGVWGPLSAASEDLPGAVVAAAMGLEEVGQVSRPIEYMGPEGMVWWALVQLEREVAAAEVTMGQVEAELREDIRERVVQGRMGELGERLIEQAQVRRP